MWSVLGGSSSPLNNSWCPCSDVMATEWPVACDTIWLMTLFDPVCDVCTYYVPEAWYWDVAVGGCLDVFWGLLMDCARRGVGIVWEFVRLRLATVRLFGFVCRLMI